MDFYDVVNDRHSTREFADTPVPHEVVERLLAAAAMAPSAMNAQPWRYYIAAGDVRERVGEAVAQATTHLQEFVDVLPPDHLQDAVRWYSELGGAPVIVVVAMHTAEGELDEINKLLSIGGSIENFLLAATAEGLGACSITFTYFVRDDIARIVEVGPEETVVSIIALGYPGAPQVSPPHETHIGTFLE